MTPSPDEMLEEQIAFSKVVATFKQYGPYALSANNRRRKDFHSLVYEDRMLLEELGYKEKLKAVDDAILANEIFIKQIVADPDMFGGDLDEPSDIDEVSHGEHSHDHHNGHAHSHNHGHEHRHEHGHGHGHSHDHNHSHNHDHSQSNNSPDGNYKPNEGDMDKLRSTLKQFVRDWSIEGKAERDACYQPMIAALNSHFASKSEDEKTQLRALVPGAGLGRLAYDIATSGYGCQGNEFSHYMLLASYFILNRTNTVNQHTLYPYVHSFSNVTNQDAMLRPISIPDVLPSELPPGSNFSLVAGDFEEVYGSDDTDPDEPQYGQFDAILTCFFIDTAKNIVNYLRIIHNILADGGVWINLGPLLWHWENNTSNDPSIELTLEEVKALATKMGFEISNERTIDTTYTSNAKGMLGYTYHAAFWTATKKSSS